MSWQFAAVLLDLHFSAVREFQKHAQIVWKGGKKKKGELRGSAAHVFVVGFSIQFQIDYIKATKSNHFWHRMFLLFQQIKKIGTDYGRKWWAALVGEVSLLTQALRMSLCSSWFHFLKA